MPMKMCSRKRRTCANETPFRLNLSDGVQVSYPTFEYPECRRIAFGEGDEQAVFIPVCKNCGRFVKADETISFVYEGPPKDQPNATCKKCGRIQMIFEGYL